MPSLLERGSALEVRGDCAAGAQVLAARPVASKRGCRSRTKASADRPDARGALLSGAAQLAAPTLTPAR